MDTWNHKRVAAGEFESVRGWLVAFRAVDFSARFPAPSDGEPSAAHVYCFDREDCSITVVHGDERVILCASDAVSLTSVLEFVNWLARMFGIDELAGARMGRLRDLEFPDLFGETNVLVDIEFGCAWPLELAGGRS